jgi:hypothetical protein
LSNVSTEDETEEMNLPSLKDIVDITAAAIVSVAAVIGGLWALRRYLIERTEEEAVAIEINSNCELHSRDYLVLLTNKGHTKVQAKYERNDGWAYNDGVEKLRHSGSLQIRTISAWEPPNDRHLDWFKSLLLEPVTGLPEVNLLTEYEDPLQDNRVDFWMEPDETYHLGVPLVLSPGLYLAKVTFIASGGDDNFWSRLFCIHVPDAAPAKPPPAKGTEESTAAATCSLIP